jgi:prevent-host-death family protein
MDQTINAKELRASLPETVRRVRRGERFTVLYRSRPAFRIVPVQGGADDATLPLTEDPLYQAPAVGRSADGSPSREHDRILYGTRAKRRR